MIVAAPTHTACGSRHVRDERIGRQEGKALRHHMSYRLSRSPFTLKLKLMDKLLSRSRIPSSYPYMLEPARATALAADEATRANTPTDVAPFGQRQGKIGQAPGAHHRTFCTTTNTIVGRYQADYLFNHRQHPDYPTVLSSAGKVAS